MLKVYAGSREDVFPKTIELKEDGVESVLFEPFEVPSGELVRFTLEGKCKEASDSLILEVPIRPWGVEAVASASGATSDDASFVVGLPAGRTYENPELVIELSPSVQRMLIELALGRGRDPIIMRNALRCSPVLPITIVDRAGDLLAASDVLSYVKAIGGANPSEAKRLSEQVEALAAELVAAQNDDGGWSWIGGSKGKFEQQAASASDPVSSARVLWAVDAAARHGLVSDPNCIDKALGFLTQALSRIDAANHDAYAAVLHALSLRGKATFEQATAVNRMREGLSDAALASLALTFVNMERASMGNEVLSVLARRAKTEPAGAGNKARVYWDLGQGKDAAETTGLASLAFAKLRPGSRELEGSVEWLLAHRVGDGWTPHKAKGPVMAALAKFYSSAKAASDRYTLAIRVNGTEVHSGEVFGASPGKTILVPRRIVKPDAPNRVEIDLEGRGTVGYSVSMTGFTREFKQDQSRANRSFVIDKRVYLAADPELDGKPLPAGFGVAVNADWFENKITQVALGGRAKVEVRAYRTTPSTVPAWQRDYLVLEEYVPAGATVIDGSVQSQASLYTLGDGKITFYFAPEQEPGDIHYEVFGYLPGFYKALPARISSAYEPGKLHLGKEGELKVLAPGEHGEDPYKSTPDELFARGKALYEAGRYAEASPALEELFAGYTLKDDVAKEAARMLLLINVKQYDAKKIVQYFEVLKVKSPELVIPFDVIRVVGKAYRDINEPERAYLIWRAIVDSSYLEDAKVGETLRQRGRTLEGVGYLLNLWREYPNTESIESDLLGLAQLVSNLATRSATDPAARLELLRAKVSRIELIHQSIRLIETFLATAPKNPLADEASLALVASYIDLEDDKKVVALSEQFAKVYPKSQFQDSFVYSEALGRFHLGEYDRAVELAEKISKAVYKDANGNDVPSPNKWQAVYILGQIFDARRQPEKALPFYEQVVERFSDAATAVKAWKRVIFHLEEVTLARPVKAGDDPKKVEIKGASAKLEYRNIAEADVKVYPVDLMRLYLTKRNLNDVSAIDLAGIHPLLEEKISLGTGTDYEDKTKSIPLPIKKEGAYLVMIRGGNRHSSGIVLASPLEMEVVEEPDSGRVRITVRDSVTKDFVPKVQVKVIGSQNGSFVGGETDLRGVFLAEGISGQVSVVARHGDSQYAFYRGMMLVGLAANQPPPQQPAAGKPGQQQSLEGNLQLQNSSNQMRQMGRIQNRFQQQNNGVEVQNAK